MGTASGGGGDYAGGGDISSGGSAYSSAESSNYDVEQGENTNIEIPVVEVHGHVEDSPIPNPGLTIPSAADPQLVTMNEEKKGLSWVCALKSALGG